jgi:hypothetical protein
LLLTVVVSPGLTLSGTRAVHIAARPLDLEIAVLTLVLRIGNVPLDFVIPLDALLALLVVSAVHFPEHWLREPARRSLLGRELHDQLLDDRLSRLEAVLVLLTDDISCTSTRSSTLASAVASSLILPLSAV